MVCIMPDANNILDMIHSVLRLNTHILTRTILKHIYIYIYTLYYIQRNTLRDSLLSREGDTTTHG